MPILSFAKTGSSEGLNGGMISPLGNSGAQPRRRNSRLFATSSLSADDVIVIANYIFHNLSNFKNQRTIQIAAAIAVTVKKLGQKIVFLDIFAIMVSVQIQVLQKSLKNEAVETIETMPKVYRLRSQVSQP